MCALIVMGALLPVFIPTARLIKIGGIGPFGFMLYRFGIWVTYLNSKWFNFNVFYPAGLIGGPSLIYLMVVSTKQRRAKRLAFPVIQQKTGDAV